MPITSTNLFSLTTIQQLQIDCKAVESQPEVQRELSSLMQWMKNNPQQQRSQVHVTLRFATASTTGRKLKAALQSLGCTVIMKTAF